MCDSFWCRYSHRFFSSRYPGNFYNDGQKDISVVKTFIIAVAWLDESSHNKPLCLKPIRPTITYLFILSVFLQDLVLHKLWILQRKHIWSKSKYNILQLHGIFWSYRKGLCFMCHLFLAHTLYSCVPGERVLILEPSWTNISVIVPMRSCRTLYSSYSAQKSSLYCWRWSDALMVLYFLEKKNRKTNIWSSVTQTDRPVTLNGLKSKVQL